jgi:cytochrome P450 family 709
MFLYWFGSTPEICVADVAVARHVLADRTGLFPKHRINANLLRLLGEGLVLANGDDWHRHKRVVHPAFNTDKLKVRTHTPATTFELKHGRTTACPCPPGPGR